MRRLHIRIDLPPSTDEVLRKAYAPANDETWMIPFNNETTVEQMIDVVRDKYYSRYKEIARESPLRIRTIFDGYGMVPDRSSLVGAIWEERKKGVPEEEFTARILRDELDIKEIEILHGRIEGGKGHTVVHETSTQPVKRSHASSSDRRPSASHDPLSSGNHHAKRRKLDPGETGAMSLDGHHSTHSATGPVQRNASRSLEIRRSPSPIIVEESWRSIPEQWYGGAVDAEPKSESPEADADPFYSVPASRPDTPASSPRPSPRIREAPAALKDDHFMETSTGVTPEHLLGPRKGSKGEGAEGKPSSDQNSKSGRVPSDGPSREPGLQVELGADRRASDSIHNSALQVLKQPQTDSHPSNESLLCTRDGESSTVRRRKRTSKGIDEKHTSVQDDANNANHAGALEPKATLTNGTPAQVPNRIDLSPSTTQHDAGHSAYVQTASRKQRKQKPKPSSAEAPKKTGRGAGAKKSPEAKSNPQEAPELPPASLDSLTMAFKLRHPMASMAPDWEHQSTPQDPVDEASDSEKNSGSGQGQSTSSTNLNKADAGEAAANALQTSTPSAEQRPKTAKSKSAKKDKSDSHEKLPAQAGKDGLTPNASVQDKASDVSKLPANAIENKSTPVQKKSRKKSEANDEKVTQSKTDQPEDAHPAPAQKTKKKNPQPKNDPEREQAASGQEAKPSDVEQHPQAGGTKQPPKKAGTSRRGVNGYTARRGSPVFIAYQPKTNAAPPVKSTQQQTPDQGKPSKPDKKETKPKPKPKPKPKQEGNHVSAPATKTGPRNSSKSQDSHSPPKIEVSTAVSNAGTAAVDHNRTADASRSVISKSRSPARQAESSHESDLESETESEPESKPEAAEKLSERTSTGKPLPSSNPGGKAGHQTSTASAQSLAKAAPDGAGSSTNYESDSDSEKDHESSSRDDNTTTDSQDDDLPVTSSHTLVQSTPNAKGIEPDLPTLKPHTSSDDEPAQQLIAESSQDKVLLTQSQAPLQSSQTAPSLSQRHSFAAIRQNSSRQNPKTKPLLYSTPSQKVPRLQHPKPELPSDSDQDSVDDSDDGSDNSKGKPGQGRANYFQQLSSQFSQPR